MKFSSEEQHFFEIPEETQHVLSKLWVVKGATLKAWGQFRVFEEIRNQLVRLPIENGKIALFISHRWETTAMPDPDNYQYVTLRPEIKDDAYYWYDYSCMPQEPYYNNDDRRYVDFILQNLNEIVMASKMLILRRTSDDYFTRGWCFHEWFTAQFIGGFGRRFPINRLMGPGESGVFTDEIVWTKHQSDRLLCGDYSFLDELRFTKIKDRQIVTRLTKLAAVKCQKKVAQTCLEFIEDTISDATYAFPTGIAVTSDDIHQRFARLVRFIKTWTQVLQQVEPVSNRIAMFFHKNHWESLLRISRPIAVNLLRLEYRVKLREEENSPMERELRKVYEFCQMKMPETRYAVTAFLCFFLMGYDI
jgi:hypothetical protein